MNDFERYEIIAMLTVIYKKLDTVERKMKGSSRLAPDQSYLDELRAEAQKIMGNIQ